MTAERARRPRICIVSPAHSSAQMGGAEYQIDCLLDVLRELDRYDLYYLTRMVSPGFSTPHYKTVRIGNDGSSPRFGFAVDLFPLYGALRAIRPDAIYQRIACGYTGIAALYAARNQARMVWHVAHDSDVMPGSRLDGRNPVRKLLEKSSVEYGIRHAGHIVTQTQQQADLLLANYRRKADYVIPNFQPAPVEVVDKSGPLTVLWIASLKAWKQPEVFVRLAQKLGHLQGVRFVMVGPAPIGDKEKPWLDGLLGSMASVFNLEYVGSRTQAEVNELLALGHVFVNTSVQEGFPNTFIQAWMRGVPVASLNVDPDGVLVREGAGVHAGTEEALADAVERLCVDTEARKQMAARAREYALRVHSLDNAVRIGRLLETGSTASPGEQVKRTATTPTVAGYE